MAVLNWAVRARDDEGEFLLERNPCKGYPYPKDPSPRRPVVTQKRYEAMLEVAGEVDWRFKLALVLAHETGHRIGAIRTLRWSDLDLQGGTVQWRGEQDKMGWEHETPLTDRAVVALRRARSEAPTIEEAWVFPAPKDASKPCSRHLVRDWWLRAEELAGLEHINRLGWHGLRRKFATELKDLPLRDLQEAGGWKTSETILECYQQPDMERMRQGLINRDTLRASASV